MSRRARTILVLGLVCAVACAVGLPLRARTDLFLDHATAEIAPALKAACADESPAAGPAPNRRDVEGLLEAEERRGGSTRTTVTSQAWSD